MHILYVLKCMAHLKAVELVNAGFCFTSQNETICFGLLVGAAENVVYVEHMNLNYISPDFL